MQRWGSVAEGISPVELQLSKDELREVHLALELRIDRLRSTHGGKLMPSEIEALRRRFDICYELDHAVQKLRGR
jgi:hypothetical protein